MFGRKDWRRKRPFEMPMHRREVKVNFTSKQATMAQKWSRDIAPFFL
jgi:hypothetical protein